MHIIIFANGHIPNMPLPLPEHDLLVAADGGARNAFRFGHVPDVLIGDFDSLTPDEVAHFDRAGTSPIRFPSDKDETDLELALDFAVKAGAAAITFYGLFGGRWDMTFANLLLLAGEKYAAVRFTIVDGSTKLYILRPGQSLDLFGAPGDLVSVLPLDGPAAGVTYTGLAWPLKDAVLPFGTPRGVSNSLAENHATITIKTGAVLVVHQAQGAENEGRSL